MTSTTGNNRFEGKTAVITGAASGIGFELARLAASRGMRVVLTDVEEAPLEQATHTIRSSGSRATGIVCDVSDRASVVSMAEHVSREVGVPWLIANNAGVGFGGRSWEMLPEAWEWSIGVNLMGVVHGIQAFLPGLVERNEGIVLNTASMAGLVTAPGSVHYAAAKHAVVGLSEALYRELKFENSGVGVTVLCPGLTDTRIGTAARNSPGALKGQLPRSIAGNMPDDDANRMDPNDVAACAFAAMERRQFWALPHVNDYKESLRNRVSQIVECRNPDDSSADPVLQSAARRA
ncbi:SDR family oxidoreductase [Okibacterium endophyticum]